MNFDKDAWFNAVDAAAGTWNAEVHAGDLALLLQHPAMIAALGQVHQMVDSDSMALRSINFTTQEGVAQAIRLQGRSSAIIDILQVLADSAEEGNKDEQRESA